ncbi:unnamed protein product [Albugo candida]|uniref:Uncharacterized protein n=1 Tax=Albugo candida TaxID=65357 RepID=A0A024FUX5_9STRA|nr:unnamed protein product [Albugo candida]|eukprot:CCI10727.1 unnamed protein product [Albugo candida]
MPRIDLMSARESLRREWYSMQEKESKEVALKATKVLPNLPAATHLEKRIPHPKSLFPTSSNLFCLKNGFYRHFKCTCRAFDGRRDHEST